MESIIFEEQNIFENPGLNQEAYDAAFNEASVYTSSKRYNQNLIAADFDGSGKVGFEDFFAFADAFGSSNQTYDLDKDGHVGFADFFLFADDFGGKEGSKLSAAAMMLNYDPNISSIGTSKYSSRTFK